MIVNRLRQFALIAVALGVYFATLGATVPPHAADASAWDADTRSAVRLIAGAARRDSMPGIVRAGLEFKLDAGWKTYWRYPGDSGVPPRFDFGGSDNVKTATVLWPAPRRLRDESGNSIGYKGALVLPLAIVPQDLAKPVTLRVKLDYAVCEKLCVPATGNMELVLGGGPSVHEPALAAAEARVPKITKVGFSGALAIRAVRREAGASRPRILVDVAAPAGETVDLFAEGPAPDWALPLPEPVAGAPAGMHRFVFELDGLPPGGKAAEATLRLTATAGDKAIEATTHLD